MSISVAESYKALNNRDQVFILKGIPQLSGMAHYGNIPTPEEISKLADESGNRDLFFEVYKAYLKGETWMLGSRYDSSN